MNGPGPKTWQAVGQEVRRRIHARIWPPGEMIPNEEDLAREFGCARATVNRALRNLSEAGFLERRRKVGTRVALHPVRKATLSIPIIRAEIAAQGQEPGYRLLSRVSATPPATLRARIGAGAEDGFLHVTALHSADDVPFMYEDRWIDLTAVPAIARAPLGEISANEWLVMNAAFTHGEIAFSACDAPAGVARHLGCREGAALFTIERATWDGTRPITLVTQYFHPGYRMRTTL